MPLSVEDQSAREGVDVINAAEFLNECFSNGHGVLTLSLDMTDEVILSAIRAALARSKGTPFVVVAAPPPHSSKTR